MEEDPIDVEEVADFSAQHELRRSELESMSAKQLKELLREMRLKTSGKKNELIERIVILEYLHLKEG